MPPRTTNLLGSTEAYSLAPNGPGFDLVDAVTGEVVATAPDHARAAWGRQLANDIVRLEDERRAIEAQQAGEVPGALGVVASDDSTAGRVPGMADFASSLVEALVLRLPACGYTVPTDGAPAPPLRTGEPDPPAPPGRRWACNQPAMQSMDGRPPRERREACCDEHAPPGWKDLDWAHATRNVMRLLGGDEEHARAIHTMMAGTAILARRIAQRREPPARPVYRWGMKR
jgi:hypothetical protein